MSLEILKSMTVEKIAQAGKAMLAYPQADCPLIHTHTPGLYCRELSIPKSTLAVTHMHKTEHPYIVSKGHLSIWTPDGGVIEVTAPHFGVTKPGTIRLMYAHEDSTWTTFHATDEQDHEKWVAENTFNLDEVIDAQKQLKEKNACLSLPLPS